jgi:predicted nucleic acid-binding protein
MVYLDSSVFLELYLDQPKASEARQIMSAPGAKISSWLLMVEVPVVLRRALAAKSARVLNRLLAIFDEDARALHLFNGWPEIAARVRQDARFSKCRALDAIHLASAVLVGEEMGRPVQLATFDEGLRTAALGCGLSTVP